ncbi:hypothetical protein HN51_013932 [Arachis hypogaea]
MPRRSSIAIPFASLSLAFVVAIPFAYSHAFVIAVPFVGIPFIFEFCLMFPIHLLLQLLSKKDFSKKNIDKLGHEVYEPLDVISSHLCI